jgi:hypothetical protein
VKSGPLVLGTLVAESFAREQAARLRSTGADAARRLRARHGLARWWGRVAASHGPASSPRAIHESSTVPLLRILGYVPDASSTIVSRDRVEAVVRARGRTPLLAITVAWNASLDSAWRAAVGLGTQTGVAWCLVANGPAIHLVDAARPYARRHVGVDLATAASADHEFDVLWALCGADRLVVRREGPELDALLAASERHLALTCAALDRGVRAAFDRLRGEFERRISGRERARGAPSPAEQALTVVFRLLFLLYAESRHLLPTDHPIFRDAYAIATFRDGLDSERLRGWWPALRAIMRMAHDGCRTHGLDVTAFNGRLFAPNQAPLVETSNVADDTAREVIGALATRRVPAGTRSPIPYAELGVEQLGAIYERLIDVPRSHNDRSQRASTLRKATGTFYTPRALTDFLVRRALAPLADGARPDAILALRVLDPAMGSGAFLVAACRYLAAAYERAVIAAGQARAGDLGERDRATFRRLVAQRCLYGVDLNPMAVQLARLSLWLTTLARDQPLSFLDHRLRVGDSLVGATAADIARQRPGAGRGRAPEMLPLLAALDPVPPMRLCVTERVKMALTPDSDVETVRAKEAELARLDGDHGPLSRWRRAADVWCAGWFWPAAQPPSARILGDLLAHLLTGSGALAAPHRAALLDEVERARERRAFFHWTFEFPEVFADADGRPREDAGFDAVLGNPPWDMLRAEDGNGRQDVRAMAAFVAQSGLYSRSGESHVNRYQLFVERALDLVRHRGRVGLIVPWGLFGDAGSAALRRRLLERTAIDTLVTFDNRHAIFPIHRSVRFAVCALTAGEAAPTVRLRAADGDVGGLDAIADRGTSDEQWPLVVSCDAVRALVGETVALPAVRTPEDLALLLALRSAHRPLADPDGWGVAFGRELNATEDRPALASSGPGYPVIEGKHLSPFRVNLGAARWRLPEHEARRRAPHRFDTARVAFRDVAGAGNRLTLIAAVLPAGIATTHTVFTARTGMSPGARAVLCALLNSLVANWYVRHWVSTHVTTQIVHRLPVPWLEERDAAFGQLAGLASSCAAEGEDGPAWVALQACAARAYGLTPEQLDRVLSAFPLIDLGRRASIAAAFAAIGDEGTVGAQQRPGG